MAGWNENGRWCQPSQIWKVEQDIPQNAPDNWLSKPDGDYYIGISFHISPFGFIKGSGRINSTTSFKPSDFHISRSQDPYNSWGVNAIKSESVPSDCMEYWNWLPGISIISEVKKFTLPSEELSAHAGTEWADNDARVFHGIFSDDVHEKFVTKYMEDINTITGPRVPGWPFGLRQLKDAVFIWVHSESKEIHAMLLASVVQSGDKYCHLSKNLYDPGTQLGSWINKPSSWDCRHVLKSLYKSRLLLNDGFHEIALVSSASAVERAFFEIVLFLEHNNTQEAENKIKAHTFRERAGTLISSYGYTLPTPLFNGLTKAYKARNAIAHKLTNYTHEKVKNHIDQFESVIEWYFRNI